MKRRIGYISLGIVLILTLAMGVFFIFKLPKTLNFSSSDLISIEIEVDGVITEVDNKDFDLFLESLNKIKFKEKNTKVKTRGTHFVKLHYKNEIYEIGRYYSKFNNENKYTLFNEEFNEFVEFWTQ